MPQGQEQTISYYSSSYTGKEIDNAVANVEINATNIEANGKRIRNHETTLQTVKKELENRYTKDEADNKFVSAERFYTKDEIDEINNNFSLQKDTYTKQEVIDKLRALYKELYLDLYEILDKKLKVGYTELSQIIATYHKGSAGGGIFKDEDYEHKVIDVPADFIWRDEQTSGGGEHIGGESNMEEFPTIIPGNGSDNNELEIEP